MNQNRRNRISETMFRRQHLYLLFCALPIVILLNSCDVLVEEILEGCNSYNYPVLSSNELKDGKVNEVYSDHVSAEIKNDPHDDSDYHYYFNVTNRLPDGMDYFIEGRKVFFDGVPTESGSFPVAVEVWVEVNQEWWYLEEIPELCDEYVKKVYTINIGE